MICKQDIIYGPYVDFDGSQCLYKVEKNSNRFYYKHELSGATKFSKTWSIHSDSLTYVLKLVNRLHRRSPLRQFTKDYEKRNNYE